MIKIKDKFELLRGTKNILSESESTIRSFMNEENTPRSLFAYLKLHEKKIQHFTKDIIFDLITNIKKRENIVITNFTKYPLPTTYNTNTKSIIINLKSFNAVDISYVEPRNLYSCLVYGYYFKQLVTGKVRIPDMFAPVFVSYLLSVFIKLFGKTYGLLGIYTSKILKLKFLISCYVLSSFYGITNKDALLSESSKISPYNYKNEADKIKKYNFQSVVEFIQCLSDLNVMPGIRPHSFSSKMLVRFRFDFLPAIEDLSRFLSIILISDIPGTSIVPTSLYKQNEKEFDKIIALTKSTFK